MGKHIPQNSKAKIKKQYYKKNRTKEGINAAKLQIRKFKYSYFLLNKLLLK